MWLYHGAWPAPKRIKISSPAELESLYVLGFAKRTKVGVSRVVHNRIQTIAWEHDKLSGETPQSVAISLPTPGARLIEAKILRELGPARLKGEYSREPFDAMVGLVTRCIEAGVKAAAAMPKEFWGANWPGRPALYHLTKPVPMWQVVWRTPKTGNRHRKHFIDGQEAKTYHASALDLWLAGLLEKQLDALEALKIIDGEPVSLVQLARGYMRGK